MYITIIIVALWIEEPERPKVRLQSEAEQAVHHTQTVSLSLWIAAVELQLQLSTKYCSCLPVPSTHCIT